MSQPTTVSSTSFKTLYPQKGNVCWMGVRPGRDEPIEVVSQVQATTESGIIGDRFSGDPGADRQVTLIQQEHLQALASILGCESVDPALTRRNIVVSGINLTSLKGCIFAIGNAVLQGTGNCPPCSKMEQNLGPGGYNAMRGHGGITACVIQDGTISVGDEVRFVSVAGGEFPKNGGNQV